MFVLMVFVLAAEPLPFPEQPEIFLERHTGAPSPLVFFSPHENENVANAYLIDTLRERGGRYLILRHRGERHLTLRQGDLAAEVDPNRIFTPLGARATVQALNPDLTDRQCEVIAAMAVRLGRFILDRMDLNEQSLIVAVHNNTDGYDDDGHGGVGTVSIKRYARKLADGAGFLVAVHEGRGDEDNLFFINRRQDFDTMKRDDWHLVLQHPRVAEDPDQDDGSLSVYAEMIGRRYINIEAQRRHDDGSGKDHAAVQRRMIDYVFDLVD